MNEQKVKLLRRVWLFVILWTVAYQAPPSTEFSRQEYWSGLSFPSSGDFLSPEGDTLTNEDFRYKCKSLLQMGNFSSVFRAFPMSAFS